MSDRQTVTIERLGHQGDGIAPGPLYAARTLPGEVVSGLPAGDRLQDIRIETPSEHRVNAPCRHYKSCGGCQLQHASDSFVAEWKTQMVQAALAAHDVTCAPRAIQTSPPRSRRRATLAVRRTKAGATVGFYGRASDAVTEIPDCQLLHPDLLACTAALGDLARTGASRKAPLAVTVTQSANGPDIAVSGGKPLSDALRIELSGLAARHDMARLSWNGDEIVTRAAPQQQMGLAQITPPPGAFLQATKQGEAALVAAVQEATKGAKRVVDLFAGSGTFSLPLAQAAEVHAVEGDPEMMVALDKGWRFASGLKKVTTQTRDLFRNPLMADELARFDAIVLDPPRAGAEAQTREITQAKTPKIAYVSCNPTTFARDANRLISAGYRLEWLQVVDQFRWSTHIELAASFVFD